MVQQIKRQLDKDTDFLIKRKSDAPLYHILFSDASRPKQTQWKQNPAFSQILSVRLSPMNRPLIPMVKPTITIKCVSTAIFNLPERKIVLDLSNDPDHPIEQAPPTISRLSKKKLKTHDCTICHRTRHDKVHCDWYCCKHCNLIRVEHLSIECLVFLAAPVVPIPSTSTQPSRPTPPSSYFGNWTRYLNQIVPSDTTIEWLCLYLHFPMVMSIQNAMLDSL